jgi:hypothetical protein
MRNTVKALDVFVTFSAATLGFANPDQLKTKQAGTELFGNCLCSEAIGSALWLIELSKSLNEGNTILDSIEKTWKRLCRLRQTTLKRYFSGRGVVRTRILRLISWRAGSFGGGLKSPLV